MELSVTRTRVKICGMTRRDDALQAVQAGVDALGFCFVEGNPRRLDAAAVAALTAELPPFVDRIGVFADAPVSEVVESVQRAGLTGVQLDGAESPQFCRELQRQLPWLTLIKSLDEQQALAGAALPYSGAVSCIRLISGDDAEPGTRYDWNDLVQLELPCPVLVAGGIDRTNLVTVMNQMQPYGVEFCAGVESAPGVKDAAEVVRALLIVREVNRELGDAEH